jgi:outer membrane murein-binding lipoprotein Lpp
MADNTNTKIRNVILVLIIIISLALAGGIFVLLQQERTKNTQLSTELEGVKAKQEAAEARVEESKKMITGLETRLQEAQGKVDALSADLDKEKSAKQDALSQISKLKSDLDDQREVRNDLEKKLTQANDEAKKAQTTLKELVSKRNELEGKVKDLEEKVKQQEAQGEAGGVELGKIVVNSETSPEATGAGVQTPQAQSVAGPQAGGAQEGKVLVVNKEYNFAVISLGAKDNITVGSVFGVYHNDAYLGDVKVEKVHESMSAAGFASTDVKNKISEGDKVVFKSK